MKHIHTFESFLNEAARVPSNIMDFAKRKGPYAVALVNKAAGWAEKAGKYISGGTAIGKNYSTIILDMKHQGSEIYINLDNETIELFGEKVTDPKSFKKILDMNESTTNEATDYAVMLTGGSVGEELNEAFKDNREIVGKEMADIIDALDFLGKDAMGISALNKACNGEVPYTIFLNDETGFSKPGGLHSSSISFVPKLGSGMKVSDYIDCVNKVLDDHGYDKFKVKILK